MIHLPVGIPSDSIKISISERFLWSFFTRLMDWQDWHLSCSLLSGASDKGQLGGVKWAGEDFQRTDHHQNTSNIADPPAAGWPHLLKTPLCGGGPGFKRPNKLTPKYSERPEPVDIICKRRGRCFFDLFASWSPDCGVKMGVRGFEHLKNRYSSLIQQHFL